MNISLSHNDLDGVSCQLVIAKHELNVEYLNSSYDAINDNLDIISRLIESNSVNNIYITDLSLTTNQMEYLNTIAEKCLCNFIIIDHHPQTDESKLCITAKNIKVITSMYMSATKLVFEYFGCLPASMSSYVNKVNSYDIWLDTTPDFLKGVELNDLFWNYKPKRFFNTFVNNINKDRIKKDMEEIKLKREKYFRGCVNKKLIFESDESVLSFCDDFMGWIQIMYPNKKFYINATTYGRIQVRLGDWVSDDTSINIKETILNTLPRDRVITFGGHHKAFSLSHEGKYASDEITKYMQIIHDVISQNIKGE